MLLKLIILKLNFLRRLCFMKKTRFLVLALAVAVMLVGAGYAWWNQSLTIETNVSTGYIDVDLCNDDADMYYRTETNSNYVPDTKYATADSDISNNKITIDFLKMYPGSKGIATFDITNNSTLKVKFENNKIPASFVGSLTYADVTITKEFIDDPLGSNNSQTLALTPNYSNNKLVSYSLPSTFTGLEKGEVLHVTITAIVDKDEDGHQNESLKFTMTPNFLQFNN